MLLNKSLQNKNQSLELQVDYDPATNTVTDVKSISFVTHGSMFPIGGLLMKFFEVAIEKHIEETDWREIYRDRVVASQL